MSTPKNLRSAIDNALNEYLESDKAIKRSEFISMVRAHVKDYLSQKFTTAILISHDKPLDDVELQLLFKQCTEDEYAPLPQRK